MLSPARVGRDDAAAGARFAAGWVDSDRTARFNGVNFVFKCHNLLSSASLVEREIRRRCSAITVKHDDTIASRASDSVDLTPSI